MKRSYWRWTGALLAALTWAMTFAPAAQAQDALLNKLVEKGYLNQREANEIREQMGREGVENNATYNPTKLAAWIDELKWSNDLRLRLEYFDNEDQSNANDRWRFRYRLRIGFTTKFTEWATVGFGLASGDASDPVSTNESFDDSFQKDPIQIDLAYVTLQPPGWDWISVTGGKMKIPVWQPAFNSPMVYDNDITPEGFAENLAWKFGANHQHTVFLTGAQYIFNEIGNSADTDGYSFEVQGGVEAKFDAVTAKIAAGLFWSDAADQGALSGDSPNLGNSVKVSGTTTNFLADFQVVYIRGEVAWRISRQSLWGTPCVLTFSGEYDKNLPDAWDDLAHATSTVDGDQTEGYTGQVAFGGNKKKGEWQLAYQYKHLEADAVWDAFTDSDFGLGGTDRNGHVIKATYNFQEWWQLGFAAFITEKISDRPNTGNHTRGDPDKELLRVQVDNVFKF